MRRPAACCGQRDSDAGVVYVHHISDVFAAVGGKHAGSRTGFCVVLRFYQYSGRRSGFQRADRSQGTYRRFNSRAWAAVRTVLAEDVVFHRANAKEVFIGPDAVVGALKEPIADKWNVKFAS